MFTLELFNPNAMCEGDLKIASVARRPASLDGLTLGLLWNGKRGGEVALRKAAELISGKYSDVKVIRYDGSMPCEKELLRRVSQECDVIVGATAD
jgi:hypothetical protein